MKGKERRKQLRKKEREKGKKTLKCTKPIVVGGKFSDSSDM